MNRISFIVSALAIGLLLTACNTARLLVVDEKNVPIAGASVEPFSPSINDRPLSTNSAGVARIPWARQKTDAINVSKDGFLKVWSIRLQNQGVTKVVLRPAGP